MRIKEIAVRNFRILSNSKMDFDNEMCLLIGRNNTGKTSLMVLFEKFFGQLGFDFNDFSITQRRKILKFNEKTEETEMAIQLILNIEYEEDDDLCNVSEFIVDLEPDRKDVNLLFECAIKKEELLEGIQNAGKIAKEKYIKKYLHEYLEKRLYTFDSLDDLKTENRYRLIKKNLKDVKKLIGFEIIHAKRSVSSSEEKGGMKVLSKLTTNYFNNLNISAPDKFEGINKLIEDMDDSLNVKYDAFFESFLNTAKEFLGMGELKVKSNLKASEIFSDASEVVYGDDEKQLPEYLNGLGHMNILYLLLNIEIKKNNFMCNKSDIKLLCIEEPEAHTHPQLQYIFSRKVSEVVCGIPGMQTIITTHSPHIVASHPFENIRYMSCVKDDNGLSNIVIKNFYQDLSKKYANEMEEFQFLKQYLSIESSELFFADKAIFIEGISEGILLQHFISNMDKVELKKEEETIKINPKIKPSYIPLTAQNVTIIQSGANSKAFCHFLDFLEIPTLIITDIDTIKPETTDKGIRYISCPVKCNETSGTSNASIRYFLDIPKYDEDKAKKDVEYKKQYEAGYKTWFEEVLLHKKECVSPIIYVTYQMEENGYYARSFEDAFINMNFENLKNNLESIRGLKNIKEFEDEDSVNDRYNFTQSVIEKKSDFASSILFLAYTKEINWSAPSYIQEGIKWLQKQ